VSLYDTTLRITSWNDACEKRFKIPAAAAEGKLLIELFPDILSDYRYTCLQEAATEGKSFYFTNLPYDNYPGFYSQMIAALKDKNGERMGLINIIRHQENDEEVHTRKSLIIPLLKPNAAIQEMLG
jgi:PAS domain-containing protein